MPGLLFKGPRKILEIDHSSFASDSFCHEAPHSPLDRLRNQQHSLFPAPPPATGASPLTPTRQKACRPSQSQVSWILNLKTNAESKDVSSCTGQCTNEGSEGDHDLAAMVHEFIENGSRDDQCDSDGDGATSSLSTLLDNLKVLGSSKSFLETELLSKVTALLLSVNEETMICLDDPSNECKGACVRQMVVKHLKSLGYDAAICKLKWQISGNVPGGDYEYVDVVFDGKGEDHNRLILDLDFQSQFEIARPTQNYRTALKLLPAVYVGTVKRLHQILEIMSESAKMSLTQNSMHLPPWRTIEYMFAKWLSKPHERSSSKVVPVSSDPKPPAGGAPGIPILKPMNMSFPRQTWKDRRFCCTEGSKPCWEQIRRIKEALRAAAAAPPAETDSGNAGLLRRGRGSYLARRKTNKW